MFALTLAMISGQAVIYAVLSLIIMAVIYGMILWLVNYIGIPEPFKKGIVVVLAIGAVIIVINALLSLMGAGFIQWGP